MGFAHILWRDNKMAEKEELYFDGVAVECERQPDRNGEHLFVATDGSGRFVKFAEDVDLNEAIARYNELNSKEVEVIEDVKYGDVITHDKDGNVSSILRQSDTA